MKQTVKKKPPTHLYIHTPRHTLTCLPKADNQILIFILFLLTAIPKQDLQKPNIRLQSLLAIERHLREKGISFSCTLILLQKIAVEYRKRIAKTLFLTLTFNIQET